MKESDEDMRLKMGPNEDHSEILIHFQEPVEYISFSPEQAVIFANGLMQCVKQLKERSPKCH